jgi:hypothetical protein
MGLDLNTALISDTFDGLIKTTDANALTGSPLVLTDGRGNNSSIAIATAGNGVTITGTLLVDGANISTGLSTAQADIIAIETKTDFITVTGAVNLDTIKTKADFITVTQAVNLDTIESDILSAKTKTDFITVTQAVDLDTMESDILSAKTKTDFITIGQPVNLDNLESDVATAQGDITAIETKTDFITISSPLNLNTVASNASAAKTKTDFITITQAVNLDTLESDVNVAQGDITAIEAKTDFITIASALNLNTVASNASDAKTKTDFITITQAVNLDTVESDLDQAKTDINIIEGKTNFITVTQAVNLDTMESDIATNNAKNSYPSGDATKVGFISITQAVNLDSLKTDVTNLSANKYDKTGGAISGSVTIGGDLTVNGTTTTINTQTLSVEDPLIELANQNSANTVDTGFFANYSVDAGVTTKYSGLFKDASDADKFKLFKGLEVEPTTTVDTAGTGYAKGDLVVNDLDAVTISGDLTGTVTGTSVLADGVIATTQATSDNSTKVATTAFVKSVVTAEDLDFAGDSGTGAVDLDSQSLTIAGTANEIETSASGQTITIGLPSSVTVGTLTATNLGGTLSTAAQPNVTSVGTLSSLAVSGDVSIADKIIHTGDTNTAIRFPSADTVTVETNGAERMRINSSGNVGIGTTTPRSILETNGTISINDSEASLGVGNTLAGIEIYTSEVSYNPPSGRLTMPINRILPVCEQAEGDAFGMAFYTAGKDADSTEKMRIDSSGNVGIGTASPSRRLHVNSAGVNDVALFESTDQNATVTIQDSFAKTNIIHNVGQFEIDIDPDNVGAASRLIVKIDGTQKALLNNSGNLFLEGSIYFNGDTAAANALDDYEEGTFTATLKGSTTDPTTPVTTTGAYTKIGNQVSVQVSFDGSDTTGASGNVEVSGLPFTSSATNRSVGAVLLRFYDFNGGTGTVANLTTNTSSLSFLTTVDDDNWNQLLHSAGVTRSLRFSLTYFV